MEKPNDAKILKKSPVIGSEKAKEIKPIEALKHRIGRKGSYAMIHDLLYGDVFGLGNLVLLGRMKTRKSLKMRQDST